MSGQGVFATGTPPPKLSPLPPSPAWSSRRSRARRAQFRLGEWELESDPVSLGPIRHSPRHFIQSPGMVLMVRMSVGVRSGESMGTLMVALVVEYICGSEDG